MLKVERKRKALDALVPRLRFVDFEASGGGRESWPIEFGWACIVPSAEGGLSTAGWSRLIRPHESWPESGWSRHAAAVHGIPRHALDAAQDPRLIAKKALSVLDNPGLVVVSDSPVNDQFWLDRLLDTIGAAGRVRIEKVNKPLNGLVAAEGVAEMKLWLSRNKGPHRAGEDARRLADAVIHAHLGHWNGLDAEPPAEPCESEDAGEERPSP